MEQDDVYTKLQPPAATPADELCQCAEVPLKLMSALSYNPVHCMDCNLEVAPGTLAFSRSLVEAIAGWRDIYDAIDRLWLDSGPYEQWTRTELTDITSAANARGRSVQQDINSVRRCFYWYFQDQSVPQYRPITSCPVCGEPLTDYTNGIFLQRVCEKDSIVTSGE